MAKAILSVLIGVCAGIGIGVWIGSGAPNLLAGMVAAFGITAAFYWLLMTW